VERYEGDNTRERRISRLLERGGEPPTKWAGLPCFSGNAGSRRRLGLESESLSGGAATMPVLTESKPGFVRRPIRRGACRC